MASLHFSLLQYPFIRRFSVRRISKKVTGTALPAARYTYSNPNRSFVMDKDRIEGSANQAKGSLKQAAGKMTGDAKLQTEGAADKAKGKVQNAVGGAKDALRDAAKH
jgi:uncharacterized protein YjbJ (UPF0337 family)